MTFPTDPIYKLIKNPITNVVDSVKKMNGNILNAIPFDEANTDYQAYLLWVSEGNTAEAAD
tara:strand:+ start:1078 stop:1260 length:183 start_codon:yes stop_codon:yes gene_type:complete